MSKIHEIYYATGNPGKFEEVKNYLSQHAPKITLKQLDGDIPEIQTLDQKAIALDKAKKAWELLKKPVLVDDAGIYFPQYNNFPGVMTKFIYEAIGYDGIFKLVEENSKAIRILFMVYTDGKQTKLFEGRCEGKIVKPQNFDFPKTLPWNAIFAPDGTNKTYTELWQDGKELEKYNYRVNALKKFLDWYTAK